MRCRVSRFRSRLTGQCALFVLVAVVSGCSSDWTRFDSSMYTDSSAPAANQVAAANPNPYPDDLDRTTTASVGMRSRVAGPRPVGDVVPRPVLPDHDGYKPHPSATAAANGSYNNAQTAYTTRQSYNAPAANNYAPRQPSYQQVARSQPIERAPLPQPQQTYQASMPAGPSVDRTITASVDRAATSVALPDRPLAPPVTAARAPAPTITAPAQSAVNAAQRGWTATGGTTVTLQQGETLFNLSKRYGVPVQELMRANKIADADHVRAGQRIVVPTYVYSRNAPVSAPDANGQTRFARASTGSLVQPDIARVPLPSKKPYQQASLAPKPVETAGGYGVDRSMITGSVPRIDQSQPLDGTASQDSYKVVAGDTLTGIARRHGVTVSQLMTANGLTASTIRVGQKLAIPAVRKTAANPANSQAMPAATDNKSGRQSASLQQPVAQQGNSQSSKSADAAPQRTGIGTFRWPVRGKVITGFGERDGDTSNDGIDISVPEGTAVKAAENGVVVYAGSELEGFGNLVLLRHGGGWITAYAHNKNLDVTRGDVVRRGQIIARSGRTGDARTPKLHFELRKNSTPVDPMKYLGG